MHEPAEKMPDFLVRLTWRRRVSVEAACVTSPSSAELNRSSEFTFWLYRQLLKEGIDASGADIAIHPLLQPMKAGDKNGQLIQFRAMHFELAMFLAQLIGGAIYSDQSFTKTELDQARMPTNPGAAKEPSSIEKNMIVRLSVFRPYDLQVAEIANCSHIRNKFRTLWQAASAFKGEADIAAVSMALDQLEQAVAAMIREDGELTAPAKRIGRELGFDIDVHIVVPPKGFCRTAVQRFLVSFGRRRRTESVPLAIIFGRAVGASVSDAISAN